MSKVKNFNAYLDFVELNEGLTDGMQSPCNRAFENSGMIEFPNGKKVSPKEIIKAVDNAISYLVEEFSRTFKFAKNLNIIYLKNSSQIKTMAVDKHLNLYMNAHFIYNGLKMDPELIGAVIMHEVFHVLFNHIERGINWLNAQGMENNAVNHHNNNLAADVEVNQTLVKLGIISEEKLIDEIRGMYLKSRKNLTGAKTNILPMEMILENEEWMEYLKKLCPPPYEGKEPPQNDEKVKTSEEWDKGYKDGWNHIAKLIKKYGYKDAWNKLIEADIINGIGEINTKKSINDILLVEGFRIFRWNEFIFESASNEYQTYDDGFNKAVGKLVDRLKNAIFPPEDGNGPGGGGGPDIDSNVDEDDLDDVDIPRRKQKGGESSEGKGLPGDNGVDMESDDENGSDEKSKNYGSGVSNGKSDDEVTQNDKDKLKNDLEKKKNSGSSSSGSSSSSNGENDLGEIGGTGSFIDYDDASKILKEEGYSEEDLEEINKIREKNRNKNNSEKIENIRKEMRNSIDSRFVRELLDEIDVSSEKYKNIWKKIMEKFLAKKTRRAGTQVNDPSINWKKKSRIALGNVGPQYNKVDQEPQDINVYVDVSGSVNMELLEVIAKSLVIFGNQYKYSGINICPWASTSNGVYKVESFSKGDASKEILEIISQGAAQCGGGTEAKAALAAMISCLDENMKDPRKRKFKDDVHVIITDGYFDFENIETKMRQSVEHELGQKNFAEKCVKNSIWMLYDTDQSTRKEWENEIKDGKLIFINSQTVIANK